MRVTVTQEDIDSATRVNVTECAIAVALKRDPNVKQALVNQNGITIYPPKKLFGFIPGPFFGSPVHYSVPRDISRWITRFDINKTFVEPVTFEAIPEPI